MSEIESSSMINENRIRKKGAGRKKCIEQIEGIDGAFLRVIDKHIAGSPMNSDLRWTNLTRQQIADLLEKEEQISFSVTVIDQLFKKHNFRRRQTVKTKTIGSNPHRNEQFEKINSLVEEYQEQGNPMMSMDTKKKKN